VPAPPAGTGLRAAFKQARDAIRTTYDEIESTPLTKEWETVIPPAPAQQHIGRTMAEMEEAEALGNSLMAGADSEAKLGQALATTQNLANNNPMTVGSIPIVTKHSSTTPLNKWGMILDDQGARATSATFGKGLDDEAARKVIQTYNNALGPVEQQPTWGRLKTARSMVRDAIDEYSRAGENRVAKALRELEEGMTADLETPLVGKYQPVADKLRSTDRAYARSSEVSSAMKAQLDAGSPLADPTSIQPRPLSRALAERLGETSQVEGGGGPWREFVQAADQALTPARHGAASAMPEPMHQGLQAGVLRRAFYGALDVPVGSQVGQEFLKGQTPLQRALLKIYESEAGQAAGGVTRSAAAQSGSR
jgi:hypothetical protein